MDDSRGLLAEDEPTVLGSFLDALALKLAPEQARATRAADELQVAARQRP